MKKNFKYNIKFYLTMFMTIFFIGGLVYTSIEIVYRGYSHINMFILAGIVSILIVLMNDILYSFETDYIIQVTTTAAIAMVGEGIAGLIVNFMLKLNVWDYSNLCGNFFFGQCNIFYCMAWIPICAIGIPILDIIQYEMFNGEKPYYKIFGKIFYRYQNKWIK